MFINNDDQKIFKPLGSRWNACLNDYMGLEQLARYYLESANALIDRTIHDRSKLDVYIYAAVFLYRHSVELSLKELIWMSNSMLGRGKTFPQKHGLMVLWRSLKNNATSLLGTDFPLNVQEVRYVEKTLQDITKYDAQSDAFRYPFDRKMQRTHPGLYHVNVESLYKRFNQTHEYIGSLFIKIDYLYERQSECERAQ